MRDFLSPPAFLRGAFSPGTALRGLNAAKISSKPLPYNPEKDFYTKIIFSVNLYFALCLSYVFRKNKRTRPIKMSSSLLRFLLRKRTGRGVEPRKQKADGDWGETPKGNAQANGAAPRKVTPLLLQYIPLHGVQQR